MPAKKRAARTPRQPRVARNLAAETVRAAGVNVPKRSILAVLYTQTAGKEGIRVGDRHVLLRQLTQKNRVALFEQRGAGLKRVAVFLNEGTKEAPVFRVIWDIRNQS